MTRVAIGSASVDRRDAAAGDRRPEHAARALSEQVLAALYDAGLTRVGTTSVAPLVRSRGALQRRRSDGLHGGMSFTYRNPARSTSPDRLLRRASTLVVGALAYAEPTPVRPSVASGAVARYARRDHYARLRSVLGVGADLLRAAGHRAHVVADDNGLVDRAAAHRAGIGWWGKNANLLIPEVGSWFVLGSIVTDAALPVASPAEVVDDGCRSCTRCIERCPTGAIVAERTIDARRCLAWLLQDTGVFPRAHRVALGDRLYGCDVCQDVCPPGRNSGNGNAGNGDGVPAEGVEPTHAWVDLQAILQLPDEGLLERYGRWYIPKRDPRYLRRNALVVLGNVGVATRDRPLLVRSLQHADPLVRAHAVWAAARLGAADLIAASSGDPDPLVRAEIAMAPAVPLAAGARQ